MDKAVGKCNVSMRFLSIIIKLKLAGIIVLIYIILINDRL